MFRAYKAEKCKLRREKAKNSSDQFLEKREFRTEIGEKDLNKTLRNIMNILFIKKTKNTKRSGENQARLCESSRYR